MKLIFINLGVVAQMVERALSMREAVGSIPSNSKFLWCYVEMVSFMVWDYEFQVRFLVAPFFSYNTAGLAQLVRALVL